MHVQRRVLLDTCAATRVCTTTSVSACCCAACPICCAGPFPANRYTSYMTSSTSVDLSLGHRELVILGE